MNEIGRNEEMLVSVIMPVYNGAEYISKSIMSVLGQTCQDLELLLIDDGSVDRSEEIIRKIIAENGSRKIRYVKQENCGIAETRNRGLKEAEGDYVCFVDQDDTLESDCIETLMDEAAAGNADLVIGGVNKVNNEGRIMEQWSLSPQLSWSKFRITAPWGRVFKKSLIDEKQISFFNTKISEDLYFNLLFLSHANKVKVIPHIGYNWLQNQDSESHGNWSKMSDDRNPLVMLTELHKQMGDSGLIKKDEMTFFFTKYLVWYLLFCSRGASHEQVQERTKEVFAWLEKFYPDFLKYAWKSFMFPKGEQLKIRLCVAFVLLLKGLGLLPFFMGIYRKL